MEFLKNIFQKPDVKISNKPFYVLSLSGGGVLGLFTARIIEHIENEISAPIASKFDLLAGTSVGGLLALALSREIPASDVVKYFQEYGHYIFMPRGGKKRLGLSKVSYLTTGMHKAKFDPHNLKQVVEKILGQDTLLGEALHPTLVTAYDLSTGSLRVFSTPVSALHSVSDLEVPMVDIAMAASAIPALFPIHQIENHRFVDGAVYANSPDLVAFREAVFNMSVPVESLNICSVGTMTGRFFLDDKVKNDIGILAWGTESRLPTLMVAAQQQFTVGLMRDMIGDNYIRIDSMMPISKDRKIDSSSVNEDDYKFILDCADRNWNAIKDEKFIRKLINS